ncbi:Asp-tRNA(Asn)/Glu-tRNA(Gln) amidotransferase subunit GatA [Patescibacteria group bacterium]|nr:Asp-tRNA(Asn)/Glu-tRNA(Gln) amidotransferase subunit GatA [Patescibacteria group bacterium]
MDLTKLTIRQANKGLKNKNFSATELCQSYLDRIHKKNKEIFAFLTITDKMALDQAKTVDKWIAQKKEIPLLAGIPMAIKDIILVKNVKCTGGSKILENYIATYDATVVEKLRNQGAVILGKTNLDEFAMGASGEHSAFGPTKNPYDLERVPGGSSSGSAAAVAADMCCYSLGTDTGGSIRQPSSFCGTVGLKPTYGSISRFGLMAMASSLDHVGVISKTVEDCEIVFNSLKGKDPLDSTSISPGTQAVDFQIKGLKIGIPKEYFIAGMDKNVENSVRQSIKKYEDMGAKIEEISLPHTEYAIATYYIIVQSEVSANMARYDGIKYGYSINQNTKSEKLLDVYLKSRAFGFGQEVKRRIILGTYILSAGYYDAYYLKAQKVRTLIRNDFEKAFKKVDVILAPTTPTTAFKLGENTSNPLIMYLCDVFTAPLDLAGIPAINIPCDKIGSLPIGLQIIGQALQEKQIFKVAGLL